MNGYGRAMRIRAAVAGDFAAIQAIEVEAGAMFAELGMTLVAEDEPFSTAELTRFRAAGHAWVAVADAGAEPAVGYVVVERVDGNAHIEQVSVRPSHGRQGIGRALVGHVEEWARDERIPAVTLTTFADVPWNGPLYERLGYRRLADPELGPGLRSVRDREAAHGLDRWPRIAMIKRVG